MHSVLSQLVCLMQTCMIMVPCLHLDQDNSLMKVLNHRCVGNPTVLSSTSKLSLRRGTQQSSRPTLIAFVSGNPQPTGSDITWYFNNQSLPSSILQEGNELLLPSNIEFDLAGRYTCQVSTSAGTASDDFLVTVIRKGDTQCCVTIIMFTQYYK